jgi:hypothetical protein
MTTRRAAILMAPLLLIAACIERPSDYGPLCGAGPVASGVILAPECRTP